MTPAGGAPRRADRPLGAGDVRLARRAGDGPRRRHDRLGALRRRRPRLLALVQVPPPARPSVLRRPVPQLPRPGRRRARRARVHDAGRAGHAGRPDQRLAVARAPTPCTRVGRATPVVRDAGRLLLQDVHPAALGVEVLREVPAQRRRARQARSRSTAATERFEKVHRHVDVLVIGGGESGLEAADRRGPRGPRDGARRRGPGARREARLLGHRRGRPGRPTSSRRPGRPASRS